jgi:translocation and assembly module TamB
MLRQAVAAKGLEKSQEILGRLASGLGVDEVRFEEGETLEDTALLLGKYLSPDLYVSYAVGLFDNQGALVTRYRLSERLRLEVQSGSSQSMDLIYDVER